MRTSLFTLKNRILILMVIAAMCFAACDKEKTTLPEEDNSGFVAVTDVVPDAILEIRYYGTYNFVGTRIDGYLQPTALLTRQAADSLKAVSDDLVKQGYRIKIFDAYRPQRGVDHFVRWAADVADTLMKPYFYPDLDKSVLFDLSSPKISSASTVLASPSSKSRPLARSCSSLRWSKGIFSLRYHALAVQSSSSARPWMTSSMLSGAKVSNSMF